jgi:hypothetical protein
MNQEVRPAHTRFGHSSGVRFLEWVGAVSHHFAGLIQRVRRFGLSSPGLVAPVVRSATGATWDYGTFGRRAAVPRRSS